MRDEEDLRKIPEPSCLRMTSFLMFLGNLARRTVSCASLCPLNIVIDALIVDSGNGHDLISAEKFERMDLNTHIYIYDYMYVSGKINFHTANGVTSTTSMVDLNFDTFNEPAKAHVLDDTPSVLSLGKRCMEQGYSFVWPSGRDPYMINSDGEKIKMEVRDLMQYVYLCDEDYHPTSNKEAEMVAKFLGLMKDNRTVYGHSGGEMSESSDEASMSDDVGVESMRKTEKKKKKKKKKRSSTKKHNAVPGEDVVDDEDGFGYEQSELSEDEVRDDDVEDAREEEDQDDEDEGVLRHGDELDGDVGVEVGPREEKRDDDDLDIEGMDGEVRLAKRGTLKHEAETLQHLLTHRYKNPYWNSCIRAKMKHHRIFRGAFRRKLSKFGDLITFDFTDTQKTRKLGYDTVKEILVVRDRYTGIIQSYPTPTKNTDDVVLAIKKFMSRRVIREAYSDKARQFEKAMDILKIPFDHALPGRPSTNSLAERNNQFILATATTTCLLEAGLPACFWKIAITCVCHLLTVEPGEEETSSWCKLHGDEFKGETIPFGALVYLNPSTARRKEQSHKFDPKGIPGIFAGYKTKPGVKWSRQYRVRAASDMTKQNYSFDAKHVI